MNARKLKKILDLHAKWLKDEKGGIRANLSGADLSCANLRCANLRDADLHGSDLSGADLSYANLSRADLRDADLSSTILSCANLRGADLRGANLIGSDLSNAAIDEPICRMDFGRWSICIRKDNTSIGCISRNNSWWLTATDDEIAKLDEDALSWWQIHGGAIKATIRCVEGK